MTVKNTPVWTAAERRDIRYTDGITKITDPFWVNTCRKCGKVFMSCICTCGCPGCGSKEANRRLGNIPYDRVVAQRGEPYRDGQNRQCMSKREERGRVMTEKTAAGKGNGRQ